MATAVKVRPRRAQQASGKPSTKPESRPSAPPALVEPQRKLPAPRPELREFARVLNTKMLEKGLSASDLARMIWGTTTDYRGYKVARNRDRIGNYLAGVSYPNHENLHQIAVALGVDVGDLALTPGPGGAADTPQAALKGQHDVNFTMLSSWPGVAVLTVRQLVPVEVGIEIVRMLAAAKLPNREVNRDELIDAGEKLIRETANPE